MRRDRLSDLTAWYHNPNRKPLIIRGSRQTGKSWLVNTFAQSLEHFVSINLVKDPSIAQYFKENRNIHDLLDKLSIHIDQKITPGKTLLFFDEIQTCEEALRALPSFKDGLPDLHVIAAGSLLDFPLRKLGLSPAKVEFMHLHPLSFGEFLSANHLESLREHLKEQTVDAVLHTQLLEQLKHYMWLGGMPTVVEAWVETKDPLICQNLQDKLIENYRVDFHSYIKPHEMPHAQKVFEAIPTVLGCKFIYSQVDRNARVEAIKNACFLLKRAGVTHYCYHTSAQTQPLSSGKDQKKFKTFSVDIGIAQRLLGLDIHQWLLNPLPLSDQHHMVEQFIAQELVAYSDHRKAPEIYYWNREAKNSKATVDFVVLKEEKLVPIKIKLSKKESMTGLRMLLASSENSDYGLKISENNFNQQKKLYEIPIYALEGWLD